MYFNIFKASVKVSISNIADAINLANFCEIDLIESIKEVEDFHKDMEYIDSLYPF